MRIRLDTRTKRSCASIRACRRISPAFRACGMSVCRTTRWSPDREARPTRMNLIKQDIPMVAYVPYGQFPKLLGQVVYALRAAGDPMGLAAGARQIVRQTDARIPISNIVTQAGQIDQTISQERTFATLC